MKASFVLVVALAVTQETLAAVAAPWRRSQALDLTRKPKIDMEWCDEVLGCLLINDDWYLPNRPINVMPFKRDKINTQFLLHTTRHPAVDEDVYISANRSVVDATTFDPSKPIKIITHGFIDTGNTQWLKDMARALLSFGDYNVIRTDWGDGSLPMYYQASANIRVVGLEIAHLLNFLSLEYGAAPSGVHLLGHSLGSHASGYAGEEVAALGRISGLDPAGPYFAGTPEFVRLDPTDAAFVDCVHTDADSILMLGYGTEQAMGVLDFYPNSGHDQPGCDPVSIGIEVIADLDDGIRDLGACSHGRAYKLFTDSLLQPCPYLAHECYDYASFEQGRCVSCMEDNSKCAFMGINADQYTHKDRQNVRLYFDTDDAPPYCYYHYQVIIDTAHPKKAEDWVQGQLTLWLYGDNGLTIEKMKLTDNQERFDHGQPKFFMFTSHTDLSRVIRMEAKWEYDSSLTNPGSYCWLLLCNRSLYVRSVQISPMDYYPEENRLDHRRVLCQAREDYVEIKSGHSEVMVWDEDCVFTINM